MSRKPMIAGNWKMNLNHVEAVELVRKVAVALQDKHYDAVDVTVIPPFTDLLSVQTLVGDDKLRLTYGAQDLSAHASGPYTGDISGAFLTTLGCNYVVVGHSERRAYHGESDTLVAAKAAAALGHGLTPIICIGEHAEVRQAGNYLHHNVKQLHASLAGLSSGQISRVVIAYEPVWAIGTGRVASAGDAQEVCAAIRNELTTLAGERVAQAIRVLYGGSVDVDNIGGLIAQDDVDGALVGGAALNADHFATLVLIAAGDRPGAKSPVYRNDP